MNDNKRSAFAVKDITLSVISAVTAILGAVLVFELTSLEPLFVGMIAVLAYMLFLAVYFSLRLSARTHKGQLPDKAEKGGDLTAFLFASPHPTALTDLDGALMWYNNAFSAVVAQGELSRVTLLEDVCTPIPYEDVSEEFRGADLYALGAGLYISE